MVQAGSQHVKIYIAILLLPAVGYLSYIFRYDSKGNIAVKKTFSADNYLKETVSFTYLNQPNSFRSLIYFSDPFNVFDMQNAIDVEACWNEQDASTAIYTDANGHIREQKEITYVKIPKTGLARLVQKHIIHHPATALHLIILFLYLQLKQVIRFGRLSTCGS